MERHRLLAGIPDQHTRTLETPGRKLTGLATLPFWNTEKVLRWGFSLFSPSTAPAQHLPSFLAGKTNTFGIYSQSSNHYLTPQLALGSINHALNLGLKTNKKLLAEVYTLFLPG